MQHELNLLAEMTFELKRLDEKLVARCDSYARACRLCIEQARVTRPQEEWADLIKMNRSQFKQALEIKRTRNKNIPAEKEEELQLAAGNLAISQWRDLYRSRRLDHQRTVEEREAELLKQLAQVRSQRGVA